MFSYLDLTARSGIVGLAILVVGPFATPGAAPASKKITGVIGNPASLRVQPERIHLQGPRAMQQIVVTGHYQDGSERDLTSLCDMSAETAGVVTVGAGGFVQPLKNGRTLLAVKAGPTTVRVPVVVEEFDKLRPISFRNEFIAALNVAGCNAGACHGIPSGRGGFKLSLRGHDPAADYLELTKHELGRRTNRFDPNASLIVNKGMGLVPHEGGPRLLSSNPLPAQILRAWQTEGLRDDPADLPSPRRIEILPGARLLRSPSHLPLSLTMGERGRGEGARRQQLAVRAHFADGSVRDVTRLTVFKSSDEAIAQVDVNGLVEMQQAGEAAVLCRYLDIIETVRLTYLEPRKDFVWPNPPENNYVDKHVFAKLKLLNLQPSELCSDQEFLRRAYLDLCGVLPTSDEARTFLADKSQDKRTKLIDQLLDRPEYADFWTHKWLDLLRSNRRTIQIKGSHLYRQWLRGHFARNTPWNQVVREILTAGGSTFSNPPANFFRGTYDNRQPVAVRDPQSLAETTAQLFLGIRMQCAQCHNHPYERWTQDDYYHLAAWFAHVKAKPDIDHPGLGRKPYVWMLSEDAIVVYPERGGDVTQPRTGQRMTPKLVGMPAPLIPGTRDRRAVLADLVTAADNPFFAKAMVNRIWFHLHGKGIVDPPDDFRDSNPSANDALLDALAKDFVAHKFDVKHIIRTIVNSRTYQLSSHANKMNQDDNKYFSHALVMHKRLSAEVLLDAICAATDVPEKFIGYPLGTRAVQLADGDVIYTGGQYATWDRHPFLKMFGQPAREISCECEREGDVSVARVLELKNGPFVQTRVGAKDNRLGKLLAQKLPDAKILEELCLATLSRSPLPHEVKAALELVERSANKREAWEAVVWALLNTDEFLLRH
jgi:hypothetical protein